MFLALFIVEPVVKTFFINWNIQRFKCFQKPFGTQTFAHFFSTKQSK